MRSSRIQKGIKSEEATARFRRGDLSSRKMPLKSGQGNVAARVKSHLRGTLIRGALAVKVS